MNLLPDQTLAYIAGLVDGEGCITLSRRYKSPHRINTWMVQVDVSNTNLDVLYWLQKELGIGRVVLRPRLKAAHKQCGKWYVQTGAAAELLQALSPWLRIKKAQAQLAIAFQATKQPRLTRGIPAEIVAERLSISDQLYRLNQRGVAV